MSCDGQTLLKYWNSLLFQWPIQHELACNPAIMDDSLKWQLTCISHRCRCVRRNTLHCKQVLRGEKHGSIIATKNQCPDVRKNGPQRWHKGVQVVLPLIFRWAKAGRIGPQKFLHFSLKKWPEMAKNSQHWHGVVSGSPQFECSSATLAPNTVNWSTQNYVSLSGELIPCKNSTQKWLHAGYTLSLLSLELLIPRSVHEIEPCCKYTTYNSPGDVKQVSQFFLIFFASSELDEAEKMIQTLTLTTELYCCWSPTWKTMLQVVIRLQTSVEADCIIVVSEALKWERGDKNTISLGLYSCCQGCCLDLIVV